MVLDADGLEPGDIAAVAAGTPLAIPDVVIERMASARVRAEAAAADGGAIYGLTTGLGHNRNVASTEHQGVEREREVLRAHAAGIGAPMSLPDTRALLAAAIGSLGNGGSAAHPRLVDALAGLLDAGIHPLIPADGSVGAADLAPMASLGLVLIGEGWARDDGKDVAGAEALRRKGLVAYVPHPQDALSLLSCNAFSIGVGSRVCIAAQALAETADVAGALSWHAIQGDVAAFDSAMAEASTDVWTIAAAASLRDLCATATHVPAALQDPLSYRVMPQVHGALRRRVDDVHRALVLCLRARPQNPLIAADGRIIANGNFHVLDLAMAFETLRLAVAHVALLSERRINKYARFRFGLGDIRSGDPGGLVESGMLAYTAAALIGRIRHTANPASLGAPPLDLDVEDHSTLAPLTVVLTRQILGDAADVLAIEAVLAADALSLRGDGDVAVPLRPALTAVITAMADARHRGIGATVAGVRGVLDELSAAESQAPS